MGVSRTFVVYISSYAWCHFEIWNIEEDEVRGGVKLLPPNILEFYRLEMVGYFLVLFGAHCA